MKVFQTYQGIVDYAFAHDEKSVNSTSSGRLRKRLSSLKSPVVCSILASGCIFVACFVYFDARTFPEISEAVYTFLTLGACFISTKVFHVNKQLIFEIIEHFEDAIITRKYILAHNSSFVTVLFFHSVLQVYQIQYQKFFIRRRIHFSKNGPK